MNNLRALSEERNRALSSVIDANDAIGRAICDALRPILPGIRHTLGWAEAGPDTLCFWCEGREAGQFGVDDGMESIDWIIRDLFRERGIDLAVDTPFGLYVTKDEAKKVQEALVRLLDGE